MITYTNTSANGCVSTASQDIVVMPSQPFICGTNFSDIRDNNTYPTVSIGTQCWFSSNLNYGQYIPAGPGGQVQRDNCTIEKYCYSNSNINPDNCNSFGGLYQWDEMMQYDVIETAQ